ncbi:hypothetical protein CBR_g41405 [Chara braunii]|uniref:Uroporphyrinogen decarboxylase n=1 Tax=Chara braunii TaxID=69332 RepID=A0A388LVZ7_CHABU|nr:hypothetical protein CBR_g41405 [Chara braunii]|eukprot:GBG86409.1 hypothetical protein CBR_g41405 [Chara braunii]
MAAHAGLLAKHVAAAATPGVALDSSRKVQSQSACTCELRRCPLLGRSVAGGFSLSRKEMRGQQICIGGRRRTTTTTKSHSQNESGSSSSSSNYVGHGVMRSGSKGHHRQSSSQSTIVVRAEAGSHSHDDAAEHSRRGAELAATSTEPLIVRAARGEPVPRPPVWMMRQAGRYMAVYRELAKKHKSFRERSENVDLVVEISLQPWHAFRPDGVIFFSDILTPLPAMGIPFQIDDVKGPIIEKLMRTPDDIKCLHPIELDTLGFIQESLRIIKNEIGDTAGLLGFVGAPWTLATYVVEGKGTKTYTEIKRMMYMAPDVLKALLSHFASAVATYIGFQIDAGAQCVQIFDSWGGQLTPDQWDRWSKPYITQIVDWVHEHYPGFPLILYASGSGGLLERMATTGVDVISLDWTIDMADGRERVGRGLSVQGNVDPAVLFAGKEAIEESVKDVVRKAGNRGHILNLGHGVMVGTPEENVAHYFAFSKSLLYAPNEVPQNAVV